MRFYLMILLLVIFSSCVRNKNNQAIQSQMPANANVFEVTEVVQASKYTYLKVKENFAERWVAVGKQEINVGDVYYYDSALEMNNFHSKDLDRTFDVVYFVNQISKTPLSQNPAMGQNNPMMGGTPAHTGKVQTEQSAVNLKKPENELTIAQIFENRAGFSGKETEIRGVVVKVNKSVMGKNWVHIQDGTNSAGSFDLTVTTQEVAEVNDEVTFKGVVTLDKDFGSGYFYDVIMEDAVLVNRNKTSVQL